MPSYSLAPKIIPACLFDPDTNRPFRVLQLCDQEISTYEQDRK
jgi:hypothetical protein